MCYSETNLGLLRVPIDLVSGLLEELHENQQRVLVARFVLKHELLW